MTLSKQFVSLAAALSVSILSADAVAGDALRFETPSLCETDGGSTVELAPGRYLPEVEWIALDFKWRELEDKNTVLLAENKYLRESPDESWWSFIAIGVTAGIMIHRYSLQLKWPE